MSVIGFAPLSRAGADAGIVARDVLAHIGCATRLWLRAMMTRRQLYEMDDRMLADLGISRAQAAFELSRSSWDIAAECRVSQGSRSKIIPRQSQG